MVKMVPCVDLLKICRYIVMTDVRIVRTRLIWPGRSGWTFGRWIFIKPNLAPDHETRLLRHERVHVEQYREHGIVGFLARYLSEYFVNLIKYRSHNEAYRQISFEIEARGRSSVG